MTNPGKSMSKDGIAELLQLKEQLIAKQSFIKQLIPNVGMQFATIDSTNNKGEDLEDIASFNNRIIKLKIAST